MEIIETIIIGEVYECKMSNRTFLAVAKDINWNVFDSTWFTYNFEDLEQSKENIRLRKILFKKND